MIGYDAGETKRIQCAMARPEGGVSMERVTQKNERGYYLLGDGIYSDWGVPEKFRGDAVDRLAAYEEMGVEPEEIAALISPPNDPLTLEELREMDGDKIYIQHIGACKGFFDDEYAPYYGKLEQYVQKYNGMLRACDLPSKYYGEAWLAYRRNPEEGEA